MKEIYDTRRINREEFILAEHLANRTEAEFAAFVYRAEGWKARIEPRDSEELYYIWVGGERKNKVHLLPIEKPPKRRSNRSLNHKRNRHLQLTA
jgi:hypothetical protein